MSMMSQVFNPIKILGRQAKSYAKPMGALGLQLSKEIAAHATAGGLLTKTAIGAGVGAAGGAGYGAMDDRATSRSIIKAGIAGAIVGGIGGAGYGMGKSAYALRGSESALNLGANATLMGRDMRSSAKSLWQARGLGATPSSMGQRMGASGRSMWGKASGSAVRGYNTAKNYASSVGSAVEDVGSA